MDEAGRAKESWSASTCNESWEGAGSWERVKGRGGGEGEIRTRVSMACGASTRGWADMEGLVVDGDDEQEAWARKPARLLWCVLW